MKYNTDDVCLNNLMSSNMKKIVLILIVLQFYHVLRGQAVAEKVTYDYQIAYCVGAKSSTAWIGDKIVLMIEAETPDDRDPVIMNQVIKTFENVIDKFEEFTGLDNLPIASGYKNKPVIEIVLDNCGAGGLASHGVLGMSTGVYFFNQFYNLTKQGTHAMPQVFLYELNRNFWLSGNNGFNRKFDWAMDDQAQNYGWWTVGMNNAQAYIVPHALGIKLHYFGTTGLDFWKDVMIADLTSYLNDPQYSFDNGWRQKLMPWRPVQSINNLMSGFIIYSYENFGGEKWMKGFYEYIQNNDIPDRSDVFAYQECRDNIYKIWSFAAEKNLISFFENDLRWTITQDAKDSVDRKLGMDQ